MKEYNIMSRIYTNKCEKTPSINQKEVLDFFEERAKKANTIGYKQAVIYQDKNPNLAEKRDKAEKELLLPKFKLSGRERVLDIGCGTGRWAEILKDKLKDAKIHMEVMVSDHCPVELMIEL